MNRVDSDGPEAGYTLAETLAALFMIGLALAGLSAAAQVIGRLQGSAGHTMGDSRRLEGLRRDMAGLFTYAGPFNSDDPNGLTGDGKSFSFACGRLRCGARLQPQVGALRVQLEGRQGARKTILLPRMGGARFVYQDGAGAHDAWPVPGVSRRRLGGVALVRDLADGPAPVAVARLWNEQAAACEYDMILQDCRGADR